MKHKIILLGMCILVFGFVADSVYAQSEIKNSAKVILCSQAEKEKLQFIKEAEEKPFRVRRIEFLGNTYTRDRIFRERMSLTEGDIFSRKHLLKSIKGINKTKTIYPILLEDLEIRLSREHREINLVFCVKQKEEN